MVQPEQRVIEGREDHKLAHLLIVDDDVGNVRLLERILAEAGYTNLRSVTDPREVLPLLNEFQPDLVLLDLLMPHLDGFAVMEQIRSRVSEAPDLPILVLTVDITPEAKRRSLLGGASDFLTKPLDQVEVLLRIGNMLEMHFLHLRLRAQNEILEAAVRDRTKELEQSIRDLRRVDEQRRRLVSRLVEAQEIERRRVAADIHDDPIQKMTAVELRLHALRRQLSDPDTTNAFDQLEETVRLAIQRLRRLLFELCPPSLDREGLAVAITQYLEDTQDAGFDFQVENRLAVDPPLDTRAIAYRIAQEGLANVRKHARAKHVHVLLETREQGHYVRITDDGVGVPPELLAENQPGRLGFTAMRERADLAGGWCRIGSAPGRGTTVEFWLPAHEAAR